MFVFEEQRHKLSALKFAMWVSGEQADSKTADFQSIDKTIIFPKKWGRLSPVTTTKIAGHSPQPPTPKSILCRTLDFNLIPPSFVVLPYRYCTDTPRAKGKYIIY